MILHTFLDHRAEARCEWEKDSQTWGKAPTAAPPHRRTAEPPGFASKVLSHSHRALARWSTLAEVLRNRFNGFHQRVPLTRSSSTAFQEVRRRENR